MSRTADSTTTTFLYDGMGSARSETNGSGTGTSTLTTAAFGQTVASTGSSSSAYGFGATSGYRSDGDAGLTHVGARYYDAQVGRFITRDTVLTERPYAYCDADPVNAVDPSGHSVLPILFGIAGALMVGTFVALTLPVSMPVILAGVIIAGGAIVGGTAGGATGGAIGQSLGTRDTPGSGAAEGFGVGVILAGILVFKYGGRFGQPPSIGAPPDGGGPADPGVWPPPPTA